MIRRVEWIAIALILAAYLAIADLYAVRTPAWQAPDEPAHYNYVRQIADDHRLPVLKLGDWQQDYQEALKANGFNPALLIGLGTIQYEDHQPPLYYLIQAPVYALTGGNLKELRLFSVLMGAGVVICAWATLRVLLARWPTLALAGAGFVAFIPQHLAILGSVSNDPLAELVAALTLLAVVIYLGVNRPVPSPEGAITVPAGSPVEMRDIHPAALGVLVGIALITKTTIYFLAGIAVLAVLLRWRRERWPRRRGAAHLAAVLIPAMLIGGAWWVRDLHVYGGTDFLGLQRHAEITIGQMRRITYIDQVCGGSTRCYLEDFARTTFHSFWGQFGWMALPMPTNVYRGFLVFTLVVLAGAVLFARRNRWPRVLDGPQRDALIVFAAVIILVGAEYVLYNRTFVQFQGRYLYPALIPLGFLVATGLGGWTSLVERRFPALAWLPVAAMAGLAVFALYALETYIVPNLPAW
jgi:4-amino-4-deoxy-L-arabinose transferase-like glycosyltransferase